MAFRMRGVWGGTGMAGTTAESVDAYVQWLADLGVNAIFLGVKEGDGRICWPSERFARIVKPEYQSFDLPAVFAEACRRHGVEPHAWFIDYYEGEHNAPNAEHSEWSARDAQGLPTSEETLRGHRYSSAWMCPARRPGYTDQWLVPLYEDFASRYDFVSVHHDYIRYPGDLAPDQYCFCDYCLEQIPRWAGLINEAFPDEPFHHALYDRPYLEAHWEQSPRVLPAQWDRLPRHEKARFLLEGSFFGMGREDLDYFFYRYRVHHVTEFARLSAEAVRRVNPTMKLSGAIFKNPIHSGRFIGQDWREFAPYQEIAIPMNYRDHFPGTMDHYLALLAETIERQKVWARDFESYACGVALWPLYQEEPQGPYPTSKIVDTIGVVKDSGSEGIVIFCDGDFKKYGVERAIRDAWA